MMRERAYGAEDSRAYYLPAAYQLGLGEHGTAQRDDDRKREDKDEDEE
jgi:hypothetical protein